MNIGKKEKELTHRTLEAEAYLAQLVEEIEEYAGILALGSDSDYAREELKDLVKQHKRQAKRLDKLEKQLHESWRLRTYGKTSSSDATVGWNAVGG